MDRDDAGPTVLICDDEPSARKVLRSPSIARRRPWIVSRKPRRSRIWSFRSSTSTAWSM